MTIDYAAAIAAGHVWVAESADEIVGVLVQYPTELGFYIDTVAVEPRLQGTGAGRALLQFAEQEALRRGYESIYLCTNAKMTENQVFYPRIGYVEYDRKLEAGYNRVFYRKSLARSKDAFEASGEST
ncbi:MAG: GNAT family N-acetyltransferase [Caldimonas sp.]